jgi:Peptidase C13 family
MIVRSRRALGFLVAAAMLAGSEDRGLGPIGGGFGRLGQLPAPGRRAGPVPAPAGRGVPADHIVTISANDLAHNRRNSSPGTVRYSVGGSNLFRGVHVDYPLHQMTAERPLAILSGQESADTPKVIRSRAG